MKWFRCISIKSPVMLETIAALGKSGGLEVLLVVEEAFSRQAHSVDAEEIRRWAFVKRDRAERLLPYAQKALAYSLKISRKSSVNLPQISGESSANLVDFDTSNPRGSTRDQERKELNKPPISPKGDWEGFDEFWNLYPRKNAKQDALRAWNKLQPSPELVKTILSAVEKQRISDQWSRDNGKYIPYPATWLNGKRWNDQPAEIPSALLPQSEPWDVAKVRELLGFPAIRNRFDPEEIIPRDELEPHGNPRDTLRHKGKPLVLSEYDGIEEAEWQQALILSLS